MRDEDTNLYLLHDETGIVYNIVLSAGGHELLKEPYGRLQDDDTIAPLTEQELQQLAEEATGEDA